MRGASYGSSGGGSASGGGKRPSLSCSPSQSRWMDLDIQVVQCSLDFVSILLSEWLPEAPLENRKILGFHEALEDDNHPSASYRLAIGNASVYILTDIDDRVLTTSSAMRFRKG